MPYKSSLKRRIQHRVWKQKNRDKVNEYARKYYRSKYKVKKNAYSETWRKQNPEKVRAYRKKGYQKAKQEGRIYTLAHRRGATFARIKKNYGITKDQYMQLLINSCGRCDACGEQFINKSHSSHVDHNHVTGKVRGLLCHGCNLALGLLHEDPKKISQLLKYLEERNKL